MIKYDLDKKVNPLQMPRIILEQYVSLEPRELRHCGAVGPEAQFGGGQHHRASGAPAQVCFVPD